MAQALEVDEEQRLAVVRVQLRHARAQDAGALRRFYGPLHQLPRLRLLRQRVEREAELCALSGKQPQRHVPRGSVEVCPKAAVADAGLFGDQVGEHFDHQVLGLVEIVKAAVEVERELVAVALHESAQTVLVAAEIAAVENIVSHHGAPPPLPFSPL